MPAPEETSRTKSFTRRAWLGLAAIIIGTPFLRAQAKHLEPAAQANRRSKGDSKGFAGTIRDRLWISVAESSQRMTPAESALYLGVPNVILTGAADGQSPGRQLALSLSSFTRVIWPTHGHEHFVSAVQPLLAEFPNFTGVVVACTTQSILAELNQITNALGHKDLWVTSISSEHLNSIANDEPLQYASAVILWPGHNESPEPLLARLETRLPAAEIMLGCSLQDGPEHRSKNRIRSQCTFALKAIRDNRICGLVFGRGNGITGESEVVTQAREWIREVGGQRV